MNVLLVEDDPVTARLLSAVLNRGGNRVAHCDSAEQAHDLLSAETCEAWALCLIDLTLPGRDGLWLCEWIRSQPGGEIPYLLIGTGSDHTEKLADAFEAGADDYLQKPYDSRLLELRLAVANQRILGRTERSRLSQALDEEERFVSAVFETAGACLVALDEEGRIIKANTATGLPHSLTADEILGADFLDLFSENSDQGHALRGVLRRVLQNEEPLCRFETEFLSANGESLTLSWTCRHSGTGTKDTPAFVVCAGTDITDRRRLESQLAFLAERDPLTHLFNRSRLDSSVQRALDQAKDGDPGALLYLDLDDFKIVNDTAGHAAGDSLLQTVAHLIARHVRPSDTVIRLGGDEFVLVLPGTTEETARAVADRIRLAVQHLDFTAGGREFAVTTSIGIAPLHGRQDLEDALAQADSACYASKRDGRNRVSLSRGHEHAESHSEKAWHARLVDAISHDAVDLWLQPIVSLRTGQAELQEVLLRLPGSEGAALPAEFLPSARRFNLLPELDRCVVRNALTLLADDSSLRLSINLSGRTASDPRLPDFLVESLRQAGVSPDQIVFEITESELISDLPLAIERLTELRSQGFRFALDDFGRGYSSFSYLRKLPVEIVKIDGSYTRSLSDDPASAAFVKAITELSHALGLTCVAEHVEDEDTALTLRELGVDLAQGFHLGEPRSYLRPSSPSKGNLALPS